MTLNLKSYLSIFLNLFLESLVLFSALKISLFLDLLCLGELFFVLLYFLLEVIVISELRIFF